MSEAKQISTTILEQLGGSRFALMTGAKNFAYDAEGSLTFKIGKNSGKVTHVKVAYDYGKDLYVMTFYRLVKFDLKTLKISEGLYCDMLASTFTEITGLYTKL